jgi:hypothetical protein
MVGLRNAVCNIRFEGTATLSKREHHLSGFLDEAKVAWAFRRTIVTFRPETLRHRSLGVERECAQVKLHLGHKLEDARSC